MQSFMYITGSMYFIVIINSQIIMELLRLAIGFKKIMIALYILQERNLGGGYSRIMVNGVRGSNGWLFGQESLNMGPCFELENP